MLMFTEPLFSSMVWTSTSLARDSIRSMRVSRKSLAKPGEPFSVLMIFSFSSAIWARRVFTLVVSFCTALFRSPRRFVNR